MTQTSQPPASFVPLRALGWNDRWAAMLAGVPPQGGEKPAAGRVIRRDRGWALVATGSSVVPVEIAGQAEEMVTGDWVALDGDRPLALLPRTGALRRRGSDGSDQILAANVDVVLLVCGLDRPVKPGRVHRGAIQAWDAGARPVVVLNKADLCADPGPVTRAIAAETVALDVIVVSTRTMQGVEDIRSVIAGQTAVMVGESGAGKSSLLNALAGTRLTEEGAVRPSDSKGRHTTTRRELYPLAEGGVLIDTPGIRSLGLAASGEAVASAFRDVEELAAGCRFSDCRHEGEPGCAVRQAVDEGALREERLDSYTRLSRELEGEAVRANPHERRRHERKFARMSREVLKAKRGLLDD